MQIQWHSCLVLGKMSLQCLIMISTYLDDAFTLTGLVNCLNVKSRIATSKHSCMKKALDSCSIINLAT